MTAAATTAAPRGRLLILLRESRWFRLSGAVVVWSLFLVLVSFLNGPGSKLKQALDSAPMAFFAVGLALASDARRRRGTTLRCASCDYDLTGAAPGVETAPGEHEARCPECGSAWGRRGMTVRGERLWSWRAFAVAALFTLPFFAYTLVPLATGRFAVRRSILALLPTSSLIEEVTRSRGFTMDDWAELSTRTLSPAQHTRLVRGLMDLDALSLHAWSDPAKWLTAENAAGRLTPEERGLVLRRFMGLKLQRLLTGARDQWMVIRRGAGDLDGAFTGWSIFAAVGPVKNAAGATVEPPNAAEILLRAAELAAPPANVGSSSGPAWTGVWRGYGLSASVWLIAEPRARAAGPIEWANGEPKVADDAVVVRVDLAAWE